MSLTWPLSKDTGGHKKFKVTWRQGLELRGLVVTSPQIDVTDLHPGENYIFNVAIISEDGDLKPYATGCVDTGNLVLELISPYSTCCLCVIQNHLCEQLG